MIKYVIYHSPTSVLEELGLAGVAALNGVRADDPWEAELALTRDGHVIPAAVPDDITVFCSTDLQDKHAYLIKQSYIQFLTR